MNNFVRNFLTEWRKLKLPFAGKTFVAAVSGGADSISLMLALNELKTLGKLDLRIVIAHFNHRLRGADSDGDERFVKNLAGKFDFELALGKGEILQNKGNLEQNARDARYKFLAETAANLDAHAVLTAHTLNDQAETFLSNLIRGSGLEGLGGMRAIRPLDSETRKRGDEERETALEQDVSASPLLIRPLLSWAKREDTENFCRANAVEFRYDSMNEDLAFNRVRIRKILLPLLKDFNPKIIETLAKTAELLREDALLLNAAARRRGGADVKNEIWNLNFIAEDQFENLHLNNLREIFPSARRIILRDWLEKKRGNLRGLELKHIEAVEKLIFSRKSGRIVELPGGEIVLKKDGNLHFKKT